MRKLVTCSCLSHGGFLTRRGYRLAGRGVDMGGQVMYLDTRVSVSGMSQGQYRVILSKPCNQKVHNAP